MPSEGYSRRANRQNPSRCPCRPPICNFSPEDFRSCRERPAAIGAARTRILPKVSANGTIPSRDCGPGLKVNSTVEPAPPRQDSEGSADVYSGPDNAEGFEKNWAYPRAMLLVFGKSAT